MLHEVNCLATLIQLLSYTRPVKCFMTVRAFTTGVSYSSLLPGITKEQLYFKSVTRVGTEGAEAMLVRDRSANATSPVSAQKKWPRGEFPARRGAPAGEGPLPGGWAGRWHQTAALLLGSCRAMAASRRAELPPCRTALTQAAWHGPRDLADVRLGRQPGSCSFPPHTSLPPATVLGDGWLKQQWLEEILPLL